jgi:hypothetical protein
LPQLPEQPLPRQQLVPPPVLQVLLQVPLLQDLQRVEQPVAPVVPVAELAATQVAVHHQMPDASQMTLAVAMAKAATPMAATTQKSTSFKTT